MGRILIVVITIAMSLSAYAGGVAPGSPVSATNTNAAFVFKNGDDSTVGKLGLHNSDSASCTQFNNAQLEVNGINRFLGRTLGTSCTANPPWTHNDVGSSTDNVFHRTDLLTAEFNATTGHQHTGTLGDGPILVNYLLLSGGTMSGVLDMGANYINNLKDPVLAQDAATKNYVDTVGPLSLARGGTGAALTAIAGGIVFSNGSSFSILAAGTAGQSLMSNGSGTPSWGPGGGGTGNVSSTSSSQYLEAGMTTSVCSTSTCTMNYTTAGISSVTRISAGRYDINFVGGTFSASPSCVVSTNGGSFVINVNANSSTQVAFTVQDAASSFANTDSKFQFLCMGSH